MRYRLRTLLIALAVLPPLLAGVGWIAREYYRDYERFWKSLDEGHPNEGDSLIQPSPSEVLRVERASGSSRPPSPPVTRISN